jgi:hypothetical protein
MRFRLWRCPSCDAEVRARAREVAHRCPARRLKWVSFRPAFRSAELVGDDA